MASTFYLPAKSQEKSSGPVTISPENGMQILGEFCILILKIPRGGRCLLAFLLLGQMRKGGMYGEVL